MMLHSNCNSHSKQDSQRWYQPETTPARVSFMRPKI
mgnify:CR=1 FL=1